MGQQWYIGWLSRHSREKPESWVIRLNYNDKGIIQDPALVKTYPSVQEAIDKTEAYLGFRLRLDETIDQFMGYRIRAPEGGIWPFSDRRDLQEPP